MDRKARKNARQKIYYREHLAERALYAAGYRDKNHETLAEKAVEGRKIRRLERPWHGLIHGAKHRCTKKNIPFDLTEEWARARWTGCCELSGVVFDLTWRGNKGGVRMLSPSIDRIEPSKGYTQENCRFIVFALNAMRGPDTDDQMFKIARALVLRQPDGDGAY